MEKAASVNHEPTLGAGAPSIHKATRTGRGALASTGDRSSSRVLGLCCASILTSMAQTVSTSTAAIMSLALTLPKGVRAPLPVGWSAGDAFPISMTLSDEQNVPQLASMPSGRFMVVWQNIGQDPDGSKGVHARLYDEMGAAGGDEFRLSQAINGDQEAPVVAAGADRFFALWVERSIDPDGDIFGRTFYPNGTAASSDFVVHTETANKKFFPTLTSIPSGFVASWSSWEGSWWDTYARIFDSVANPLGVEFRVNTYLTEHQSWSSAAGFDTGFVVVWQGKASGGQDDGGVEGQLYDLTGTPSAAFLVNSHTNLPQAWAHTTSFQDGFLVVWWSDAQDADGSPGVFGQRFGPDATKLGEEFPLHTNYTSDERSPTATQVPTGFLAAWSSRGADGTEDLFGQFFGQHGQRQGVEFRINDSTSGEQTRPEAVSLPSGCVVVWTSEADPDGSFGVFGRIYTYTPPPLSLAEDWSADPVFRVNTYTDRAQDRPSVSTRPDGYIVTWDSEGQDFMDMRSIYAQLLDENAQLVGPEFRVHEPINHTQTTPKVAQVGANLVVVWNGVPASGVPRDALGQMLSANGTRIGGSFLLSVGNSADEYSPVALGHSNGFVVAWSSTAIPLHGRAFDHDAVPLGGDVRVSSFIPGNQAFGWFANLSSEIVGVWMSSTQDTDGSEGIFGQRFNASLGRIGLEFQANSFSPGRQTTPVVASTPDGFVVLWQSQHQDTNDSWGVYGQRFDPLTNKIGDEFRVNSYLPGDQHRPRVASSDWGFVVAWHSRGQDLWGTWGVYAQIFDILGNKWGPEIHISDFSSSTHYRPEVAATPQGFLIAWTSTQDPDDSEGIYARLFRYAPITHAPTRAPSPAMTLERVSQTAQETMAMTSTSVTGHPTSKHSPTSLPAMSSAPPAADDTGGIIAGAVVGALALVGAAFGWVWWRSKRRSAAQQDDQQSMQSIRSTNSPSDTYDNLDQWNAQRKGSALQPYDEVPGWPKRSEAGSAPQYDVLQLRPGDLATRR